MAALSIETESDESATAIPRVQHAIDKAALKEELDTMMQVAVGEAVEREADQAAEIAAGPMLTASVKTYWMR